MIGQFPMTETPIPVHVLLCGRTDQTGSAAWLADNFDNIHVSVISDLCGDLRQIGPAIEGSEVQRLVLGVCSRDISDSDAQTHARRAGVQSTSLQLIDLGRSSESADARSATVRRASLAGAIARARAIGEPRPENLKVKLSGFDQQVSRRSLFTLPPVIYETVPTINEAQCVASDGCNLCARSCPHDALETTGGAIEVDPAKCRTCGVCVAVCPQRAVELPGIGAPESEAHVQESLRHLPDGKASLLFHCARNKTTPSRDWLSVPVPCLGLVNVSMILSALASGAGEVALLGCGDYCQSGQSEGSQSRVEYCNQLLAETSGTDPQERVRMIGPDDLPATPTETDTSPLPTGQGIRGYGSGAARGAILATNLNGRTPYVTHPASPMGVVDIKQTACTACEACTMACPTGALRSSRPDDRVAITFDHADCVACGQCVDVCPEIDNGAIALEIATDIDALRSGRRTLMENTETLCEQCGKPVAPRGMLDRIAAILGPDYDAKNMERLCVQCRGL